MKQDTDNKKHRIYTTSVASVYVHYLAKAQKKGRTQNEVDEILCWLTGYTKKSLATHIKKQTTFETFFTNAPRLHPARKQITGLICGVRIENITDPLMQEIRYLDKCIDELARGKAMGKILRS